MLKSIRSQGAVTPAIGSTSRFAVPARPPSEINVALTAAPKEVAFSRIPNSGLIVTGSGYAALDLAGIGGSSRPDGILDAKVLSDRVVA